LWKRWSSTSETEIYLSTSHHMKNCSGGPGTQGGKEDVEGGEHAAEDVLDVATAEPVAGEQSRHPYHNFEWDSSIVHNAGAVARHVR